ncbi:MAG TPA: hypothetical protein VGS22_10830 [Thermoanaerobaculia bacterium]|jgi:hypothetical protein|nr:hypothetical protein [Thermoanaerobaculia bacterium]
MATRSEKLNRLVIRSPCPKAWDEMTGTDAQRVPQPRPGDRKAVAAESARGGEVPSPQQSSLHVARYAAVQRELIRSCKDALASAR